MLHIYHPSPSNKGFACSFNDAKTNDCIFATILKQAGWDEQAKTGSFKASLEDKEGRVNIKLNDLEISAIIDCLERNRIFKTYHDGDEFPKTIQFSPWMSKPINEGDKPEIKGFSFTINISSKLDTSYKNAFYIGFNFAEGRLLKEYLVNTLNSHFNKNRETFLNKKSSSLV
jgi:hypothetical protein